MTNLSAQFSSLPHVRNCARVYGVHFVWSNSMKPWSWNGKLSEVCCVTLYTNMWLLLDTDCGAICAYEHLFGMMYMNVCIQICNCIYLYEYTYTNMRLNLSIWVYENENVIAFWTQTAVQAAFASVPLELVQQASEGAINHEEACFWHSLRCNTCIWICDSFYVHACL